MPRLSSGSLDHAVKHSLLTSTAEKEKSLTVFLGKIIFNFNEDVSYRAVSTGWSNHRGVVSIAYSLNMNHHFVANPQL